MKTAFILTLLISTSSALGESIVMGAVVASEKGEPSHSLPAEQTQNDLPDKEREKKNRRFKAIFFNDNFGSNGNETGLTHGNRFIYSQGPAEGENWSVSLQSQLYISEDHFFILNDEKVVIRPVEQNEIELAKRIPSLPLGIYYCGGFGGIYHKSGQIFSARRIKKTARNVP